MLTVYMCLLTFPVVAYMIWATVQRPADAPRGWTAGAYLLVTLSGGLILLDDLLVSGPGWAIWMRILVIVAIANLSAASAFAVRALVRRQTTA